MNFYCKNLSCKFQLLIIASCRLTVIKVDDCNNMRSWHAIRMPCLQWRKSDTFDKKWVAKLSGSNKGSFHNQEQLLDELEKESNDKFTFTNLGILTSHMKKQFINWRIIYCGLSWEICICSMLTITVLLLYRKLIPLQCFTCCDNLIRLGCRQILFFSLFLESKKITKLYVHFKFKIASRWTKLAEIWWECRQNVCQQNRVSKFRL